MVILFSRVIFKFKSSKKSNNGTDLIAGQIPQLLYRLPSHDIAATVRSSDLAEPAHILTGDFSKTVSTVSRRLCNVFMVGGKGPGKVIFVQSKAKYLRYYCLETVYSHVTSSSSIRFHS